MSEVSKNPDFRPHIGGNLGPDPDAYEALEDSYSNLSGLIQDLQRLISEVNGIQRNLESRVSDLALEIDPSDPRMVDAHRREWPTNLGEPSAQITYGYYKSLRLSNTTSSAYLREKFEEAARDITGSADLDLLILTDLTRSEALLIQDFITRHIGNIHDTSEKRILENFQDWVQSARLHTKQIGSHTAARQQAQLTQDQLEQISPTEAQQGQAVFKIKLNELNDKIDADIYYLKRNFSEYASVFYERFLGSAVDYRKDAGLKLNVSQSAINKELRDSSEEFENALRKALTDQIKRRRLYHKTLEKLNSEISDRDRYRTLIKELASKGKSLPNHGPRIMVPAVEKEQEVLYWEELEKSVAQTPDTGSVTTLSTSSGSLRSSHSNLDDLEEGDDHPQYLLRAGGTLTGHVAMDPGTTIGGIEPPTHAHTGEDGSTQVHGSNLMWGSLRTDSVDESEVPPVPHDLKYTGNLFNTLPSGDVVVDGYFTWKGDSEFDYEYQLVRVPSTRDSSGLYLNVGYLWVLVESGDNNYIHQISLEFDETLKILPVPSHITFPVGLKFFEGTLWVCDFMGESIHQLSPVDGSEISSLQLSFSPTGLTFDDGFLWVTEGNDIIYKIDPISGNVIDQLVGN